MDSSFRLSAGYEYNLHVLWEDGERVFCRGWRDGSGDGRSPVLVVFLAAEHPTAFNLNRLAHEYDLRDELDADWAIMPLEILRAEGRTMLVYEDPGGEPLSLTLGTPVEVGCFLRLAVAVATALDRVHGRGIVHKDIRPANIWIEPEPGPVRLTGFGVASRLPRERPPLGPPEEIAGTLAYMAPEQTGRMNRSVDSRSDLYAYGVTLYEMLTGALPFSADEPMEWIHCHLARQAIPPGDRRGEVPAQLSAIVMKLLAKTAEERYQTAAGVAADLRRCQADWESHREIPPFPLGAEDMPDQLRIPEVLYGRERETEKLVATFEKVVELGKPGIVLVSGYSGIGKSSVVNELHRALVSPRGLFASGKFDQHKRNIPYATLAQALQGLIRPLLGQSEAELGRWRDALTEAVGQNGQLAVHLVPELELVVGKQPPAPELAPQEAKNRFQRVLKRVLGVFARQDHPLALFLDDLQWLDAATLDLLEYLTTDPEVRHLLLIGAYRENEVGRSHPLRKTLARIRSTGVAVQEISLGPLGTDDLGRLIADTLGCTTRRGAPLTRLVHEKTGGNPFFAIQFISALAEDGFLYFDRKTGRWCWAIRQVRAKGYTDNVVDLMVGKLARLPVETQVALQNLACFGNVADLTMLSKAMGKPPEDVRSDLWGALQSELVKMSETSCRFIHDRVQEAAYSLIPEEVRADTHLRVGRLLAANTPEAAHEEVIFEIVNQLNRGSHLIDSPDERRKLSEFNLLASRRARATSAYASALAYLAAGSALLPENAWDSCRELAFTLEWHTAECEFLTGEHVAAAERLRAISSRATDTVEQAIVAGLQIDLHTAFNQPDQAIAIGLAFLRSVGIDWSPHPTNEDVRQEYEQIWSRIGSRTIEELVDLPLMNDPASRATIDVLTAMVTPSLWTDPNFLSLVICGKVNLSLQHGNSDGSCFAYAWLGALAGWNFGDYEAGFRFGRLGIDLAGSRGLKRFNARACMIFGNLVVPWTKHVRDGRALLRSAFDAAVEVGDLSFAAYSCDQLNTNLIASGNELAEVQSEAENGLEFARRARIAAIVDVITVQLGLIRTLRGQTATFGAFDDGTCDETRFENGSIGELPECRYWIAKLQARFFAGDYVAALDASVRAQGLLWTSISTFESAEYHFYSALCHAACSAAATPAERERHVGTLRLHLRQLEAWAQSCPENFETRAALVGAEAARMDDREGDAMRLYERAIRAAQASGFAHNEALANELASRFYAANGFEKIARAYMRDARICYLRWGAAGKVLQLEQAYPHLIETTAGRTPTGSIGGPVQQLDLATVVKVLQAASGEIVLEKLLQTTMRAAIEQAGAQRGLLILARGPELRVAAEATTEGEGISVAICDQALDPEAVPETMLRYVARSQEGVILDDAEAPSQFSDDHYMARRRTGSVLCLPLLKQAKLVGLLYLENSLSPRVFSLARVAVLELLASQAAISLENTYLYRDLAEREAKIRRLVDTNIIGIMIWDSAGHIIDANDAFLRIVGYERDDLDRGGLSWKGLTPEEYLTPYEEHWLPELWRSGRLQPFESEYLCKDGSRVPVMTGAARFGESGEEGVSFVLDLTERTLAAEALREMQWQLEHASRIATIGQLTSSIAHEVTQPITGAVTNIYTALRVLNAPEPDLTLLKQALDRTLRDATRAGDVVERLRSLIKRAPPRHDSLEITPLIREVIDLTRIEAMKADIAVEAALDSGLPLVRGDRVELQQVMLNLIMNAIEAMAGQAERKLRIACEKAEGGGVFVSVVDSGPGLADPAAGGLFKAFHTTKQNGLGLGLSICRSIVEAHGGHLKVSNNVPRGAIFQFELPAASDAAAKRGPDEE